MPLPILSSTVQKTVGGLKSIKDSLSKPSQPAPKEATAHQDIPPPSKTAPNQSAQSAPASISRGANTLRNRPSAPAAETAFSRNQDANEKAIARSQGSFNPLVPLIQNVNSTLIRN